MLYSAKNDIYSLISFWLLPSGATSAGHPTVASSFLILFLLPGSFNI